VDNPRAAIAKPAEIGAQDDHRVPNGILSILSAGGPWHDLPEHCGPRTMIYSRFNR
jgi:transposase